MLVFFYFFLKTNAIDTSCGVGSSFVPGNASLLGWVSLNFVWLKIQMLSNGYIYIYI